MLGHENAGWVDEIGAGVTTVAKGDAVLVFPPHSCGLCVPCRRGVDMLCIHHQFTGLTVDGGFADYVLVPERSLLALPAGIEPAAVAPHADAGLTAYHAVRRLAHLITPGSTAVVVGVGGVGHIALQLIHELGASATVAVDTDSRRRRLAAELGAGEVLDGSDSVAAVRELTNGRGADVVFDFVGTDQSHADCMAMLARGGTYSIIGFGGMLTVPSAVMVGGEQTVTGNLVGTWLDLWEVMQLQAAGPARAQDRDAPAGIGERRAREAARRRGDGSRRARAVRVTSLRPGAARTRSRRCRAPAQPPCRAGGRRNGAGRVAP